MQACLSGHLVVAELLLAKGARAEAPTLEWHPTSQKRSQYDVPGN